MAFSCLLHYKFELKLLNFATSYAQIYPIVDDVIWDFNLGLVRTPHWFFSFKARECKQHLYRNLAGELIVVTLLHFARSDCKESEAKKTAKRYFFYFALLVAQRYTSQLQLAKLQTKCSRTKRTKCLTTRSRTLLAVQSAALRKIRQARRGWVVFA